MRNKRVKHYSVLQYTVAGHTGQTGVSAHYPVMEDSVEGTGHVISLYLSWEGGHVWGQHRRRENVILTRVLVRDELVLHSVEIIFFRPLAASCVFCK